MENFSLIFHQATYIPPSQSPDSATGSLSDVGMSLHVHICMYHNTCNFHDIHTYMHNLRFLYTINYTYICI